MIDRKQVIKTLMERISACSMIGDGFDVTINWKLADDILSLLKEQEQWWIPVSKRLPEEQETIFAKFKGTDKWSPAMFAQSSEDVRVVVVFADGTRRVSHSHTVDGKWECEKSPVKRTVTHWMPNPELPKDSDRKFNAHETLIGKALDAGHIYR